MEAAVLKTESKADMKLLLSLAKKMGIHAHTLSTTEIEDLGMAYAIKSGKTKEYIDTDKFLKSIRK